MDLCLYGERTVPKDSCLHCLVMYFGFRVVFELIMNLNEAYENSREKRCNFCRTRPYQCPDCFCEEAGIPIYQYPL